MRTLVSIDGQNLYRLAKDAYGRGPYHWPSYDVVKLAQMLTSRVAGRTLVETRFYTGVPTAAQDAFWNGFWNSKLRGCVTSAPCPSEASQAGTRRSCESAGDALSLTSPGARGHMSHTLLDIWEDKGCRFTAADFTTTATMSRRREWTSDLRLT